MIVSVDAPRSVLADLVRHAKSGIERFPAYRGYVGGALHVSEDEERLIQYLQWESEEDYLACLNDPGWDRLDSSRTFLSAVESGRAKMDVRAYSVTVSSMV